MGSVEDIARLLEAIAQFAWPAVVLIILFAFHKPLRALIDRVGAVKFGTTKVSFQQPSEDNTTPPELIDARGFFTIKGVRNLVEQSGLVQRDERFVRCLPLLQTQRQHTWLVATTGQLFCILDDESTRRSGRMIQWHQDLTKIRSVRARADPEEPDTGVVEVGPRRDWLYSTRLYRSPNELESEVESMMRDAQSAGAEQ